MQEADIDKIVLEYCKKRGWVKLHRDTCLNKTILSGLQACSLYRFAQTEAFLRKEAGVDTMALSSQRLHVNSSGIVENVLYSLADQNPSQYADSFQRLAAWVDNSLDLYRVCHMRLHAGCEACIHHHHHEAIMKPPLETPALEFLSASFVSD